LAYELDVSSRQSNLLVQLPVCGLLQALSGKHAALRELPTPTSDLPSQENVSRTAHQNDADISAKAV
jgi:hypothetical protein